MLVYGLVASSAEELFWTLLSIFAMIFMLPYVLMSLAFIKLRLHDPQPRAFRMPLGNVGACLWAALVGLHVLAGILLFVVTPGEPMDWDYSGKILLGVGLATRDRSAANQGAGVPKGAGKDLAGPRAVVHGPCADARPATRLTPMPGRV